MIWIISSFTQQNKIKYRKKFEMLGTWILPSITQLHTYVISKIVTGQQTIIYKVHGKLLVKKIYVVNQRFSLS